MYNGNCRCISMEEKRLLCIHNALRICHPEPVPKPFEGGSDNCINNPTHHSLFTAHLHHPFHPSQIPLIRIRFQISDFDFDLCTLDFVFWNFISYDI